MKKFLVIAVVLCFGVCLFGCQKKRQSLEEMQQPMSPEDLNRLSSQPPATPPVPGEPNGPATGPAETISSTTPTGTIVSTTSAPTPEQKLESLPPSGPYKPSDRDIQTALKNAGFYNGTIDGKIGPKTKKAIEDFQKANGLKVDGKVGPRTWKAMSKHLPVPAPEPAAAAAGSGSTDVKVETGK